MKIIAWLKRIFWGTRISNLEIAFSVIKESIDKLTERVDELEETKEGKSCIGFIEDGSAADDEALVGM